MMAAVIAYQNIEEATQSPAVFAWLQALGWVDRTALGVLLVFFVLGLFKGLIWQVSRIGILIVAYIVAGRFGHTVAGWISSTPPAKMAQDAMASTEMAPGETTLYLAYCLLFVVVIVALSLVAMLLKKIADKAGLTFFDRLGGGVFGVATGACVVLAMVFGLHMFFPQSKIAVAAEQSHSLEWSQRAIDLLKGMVNDDLRTVLALPPLGSDEALGAPGLGEPNGPGVPAGPDVGGEPAYRVPGLPTGEPSKRIERGGGR